MESSPSSCSSSGSSPAQSPPYFRLSSEVVEKPEYHNVNAFQMVPESEMMEGSFFPASLPVSPASTHHSKSDNEGTFTVFHTSSVSCVG